jgi:hypothetical protein
MASCWIRLNEMSVCSILEKTKLRKSQNSMVWFLFKSLKFI